MWPYFQRLMCMDSREACRDFWLYRGALQLAGSPELLSTPPQHGHSRLVVGFDFIAAIDPGTAPDRAFNCSLHCLDNLVWN